MAPKNSELTDVIFSPCNSVAKEAQFYAAPMMMMERVSGKHVKLISVVSNSEDNEIMTRQFLSVCEYATQYAASVILWNPLTYITEDAFKTLQKSCEEVTFIPGIYTRGSGKDESREFRAYSVDAKTHKLRRTNEQDKTAAVCDFSVIKISCVAAFHHFMHLSCPWNESLEYIVNAYLSRMKTEAAIVKPYGMYLGSEDELK